VTTEFETSSEIVTNRLARSPRDSGHWTAAAPAEALVRSRSALHLS
jgi:phosphoribosylaminoimidazole carboxylase (NCAIR synthetase)